MEAIPVQSGVVLGFQQCATLVGDDMERVRNKFQGFVKKLDITNSFGTRMKAVKDLDQYIQKRQSKIIKATTKGSNYKENTNSSQLPVYYPGVKKYEMPYCLSIAILKLKDFIFDHQNLKKEHKFDVENFVMRCLLHQRCLIYKMPNFILYFLDQVFPDTAVKLNYLQIVTHDSQEMDPAFNSQLFLILLKSIDYVNLKGPISSALSFVQGIFSNHSSTFNETQTMQMLLRITLAGIKSIGFLQEHQESGIGQEVFQILQHFLKYNDYSPKLFNICLFTMCILSNRDHLSQQTGSVVNNLIMMNPTYIFQEIIDILQIQSHLGFWEKNKGIGHHHQQVADQNSPLRKEIIYKCFKGEYLSSSLELTDLQEAFSRTQSSLLVKPDERSPYTKKTSLCEIVCLNECFTKCLEYNQWTQIQELEIQAQTKLQEMIPQVINILENDRQQWINTMEKNFERIQRGAIYFTGKSLWGNERIDNLIYPINQVLKLYKQQITQQSRIGFVLELIFTVKQLIQQRGNTLYYEWEHIISIMNSCLKHSDQILQKTKCQQAFQEIFFYIKQLMMKNEFPDFSEGEALKCYFEFKDKRIVNDKTLTQYSLKYLLENYFTEYFERLRVSCLIQEKNQEIRTLFLDILQDFYSEQVDSEICVLFEALFTNNMESFYVSRGEYALTTSQMIQIIDILAYIAHKTEKAAYFKHVVEILQSCILFYDYDASKQQSSMQMSTEGGSVRGPSQNAIRKDVISNIPHESLKMKSFQNHSLNRLIQLFVLKGSNIVETEKSVYLYNILLKILKVSYNDRKKIICDDFLTNLKVNSYRELCWKQEDNPLFIEIQTKYLNQPLDFAARQSFDSQGNSSGGSSEHASTNIAAPTTAAARTYNEQSNATVNRTSFDKLGQDKQLIQNTLRALVHTFEDIQSDSEIKKACLKQFHKFVAFVSDEDFQSMDIEGGGPHHLIHLKQIAILDPKVEWIKIIMNLVHSYKPIEQPEYAILMIDIFYAVIALENNFKILSPQQITHLVEKLIESLYLISGYLKQRKLEFEQQVALQRETMKSGGKSGGSRETFQKQTRPSASFVAGDQRDMMSMMGQGPQIMGNDNDEPQMSQSKPIIQIIQKVISIVGFIFQISSSYGADFWNQNVIEGKAYILSPDFQMQGTTPKPVVPQVKMIEYFIDQVTALIMNPQTMYKISTTVILCIRNISCAIIDDPKFLQQNPTLLDSLIFMIFRIITPFMQNQPLMMDPVSRLRNSTYKMNKSLKELFRIYFSQLSFEDNARLYLKHFQKRTEAGVKNNLQMQMIIDILSKLLRQRGQQADDTIIKPILTLIASFDEELIIIKKELDSVKKAQSAELLTQEDRLRSFLDIIGQNLLWVSHSVYDRHCNTKFSNSPHNLINHYIMDNNLVSVSQVGTKIDVVVRNACFNYRTIIETQNMLQQSYEGSVKQLSKIRNALMWQAKGREEQSHITVAQPLNVQQVILYDATLMALLDHSSHYERKWGKNLKIQNDKNIFFKSKKELLVFPDEPKFRGWLTQALEIFPPKNIYGIEVSFVDRDSKINQLPQRDLSIFESKTDQNGVSENHLNFLTMLGTFVSINQNGDSLKGTNHGLYLKHLLSKDVQGSLPINLMVNEDDTDYIYYVSNVLIPKNETIEAALSQKQRSKLHIIYNESNYQNFSIFDPTKIFIVVTKLNETQFFVDVQSSRLQQSLPTYDSYFDSTMHSKEVILTEPLKEFKNGHNSAYAIVSQERIGQWIKNMVVVSDAYEKNQRHIRNKDCVTSNIMQRAVIIHEFKETFQKQGKTGTILKQ